MHMLSAYIFRKNLSRNQVFDFFATAADDGDDETTRRRDDETTKQMKQIVT